LRALKLLYQNHGMRDLVGQLEKSSPAVQRVLITTYHQCLEYPDSFGTVWKWVLMFYPIIWAYAWIKEKVTNVFTPRQSHSE
jgi:hypothetical protein